MRLILLSMLLSAACGAESSPLRAYLGTHKPDAHSTRKVTFEHGETVYVPESPIIDESGIDSKVDGENLLKVKFTDVGYREVSALPCDGSVEVVWFVGDKPVNASVLMAPVGRDVVLNLHPGGKAVAYSP